MADQPSQRNTHSFEEVRQWINDMTIRLKNYMPTFLKYLDIYEEMMIKGKFSKETVQKQNQFFALKEKSHAVEHYLRSIRYELAIEKYRVVTCLSRGNPQRKHTLTAIKALEKIIRDYFISSKNKEGFCNIHLYKEAEEQNTTIEVESELKYFEDCIVKERRYQESHKSIATALKLNK